MPAFSNGNKQAARVLIRKKVARLLLVLPLLLLASPSHTDEPLTNNELDQQFDQLSAFVRKQMSEKAVPGVAIGVLHSGQFKTAAFGITNVDNPQIVTPDTLFQIGSITKTMTGTVIMRLAEQGKLDLDAPVRRYLPNFRVQDDSVSEQVKVRDLLTHMSGWVGDYFNDTGSGDDALARIVDEMAQLEQMAPINTVYSYNNSGFYVASYIIQVVTGDTLIKAIQSMVFEDIGLDDSYIVPSDIMTKPFVVGHASTENGISVATPWVLPRAAWGAGGGIMTVGDMLKYADFHMGDGRNASGEQIMLQTSLQQMQTVQAPKLGTDDAIGITWHIETVGGETVIQHGGATFGQLAYLFMVPSKDFAMAIVTNANTGRRLNSAVAEFALEHFLGLKNPAPQPALRDQSELKEYEGIYSRPLGDIKVVAENGALSLQDIPKQSILGPEIAPPAPPVTYLFFKDDRIIDEDGVQKAEFVRNPDGTIGWIRSSRIYKKVER